MLNRLTKGLERIHTEEAFPVALRGGSHFYALRIFFYTHRPIFKLTPFCCGFAQERLKTNQNELHVSY